MSTMTAEIKIPWAFANIHAPGTAKNREKSIRAVFKRARGGIAGFNEANRDRALIERLAKENNMVYFAYSSNVICIDEKYEYVFRNAWRITTGGNVGIDETKAGDNRRIGPNRYLLLRAVWAPLFTDPETGEELGLSFFVALSHYIAKGWTTAKWRQPLVRKGVQRSANFLATVIDDIDDGLWFADTNMPIPHDFPGIPDVQVVTPPTFGAGRKYDKVAKFGDTEVTGQDKEAVQDENIPSDHDMLFGFFIVRGFLHPKPKVDKDGNASTPRPQLPPPTPKPPVKKPVPKLPKPGDPDINWRKYGAPLDHPWAPKSARWKSRHNKLWRKNLAWRKSYLKRRG